MVYVPSVRNLINLMSWLRKRQLESWLKERRWLKANKKKRLKGRTLFTGPQLLSFKIRLLFKGKLFLCNFQSRRFKEGKKVLEPSKAISIFSLVMMDRKSHRSSHLCLTTLLHRHFCHSKAGVAVEIRYKMYFIHTFIAVDDEMFWRR